ncbi:hypothetical protein H2203_003858 [Taxawa tesnikishii (nom. ined.)]|nr:hypothetical protein H2203_003858 [Dothideales sp. JES 119]
MTLTIHHLQVSQSERLVWLCEELGIHYNLRLHQRDPVLSPQSIKDLHPLGAAPIIEDDGIRSPLAESAACIEWIINKHGSGRLALKPDDKDYDQYLYWFHVANGSLQPAILRVLSLQLAGVDASNQTMQNMQQRVEKELAYYDSRLSNNTWLAGEEFSAADVMTVFSFTTMRTFIQQDLSGYENILAYLQRVGERPAYRKAMEKGDPGMDWKAAMNGKPPQSFLRRLG